MALLALPNREEAARGLVAFGATAHARAADENPIAVDVHRLFRNADKDHERPLGRNFRMPPVLARFKRSGRFASGCAFGVKRWLLHRLGGCEESNGNSK